MAVRHWAHGTIEKTPDGWTVFIYAPGHYVGHVDAGSFRSVQEALRNLERISREWKLPSPSRPVTHLQTDWRHIACRKGEQRGQMQASRSPADVTCPKCRAASPHLFERRESARADRRHADARVRTSAEERAVGQHIRDAQRQLERAVHALSWARGRMEESGLPWQHGEGSLTAFLGSAERDVRAIALALHEKTKSLTALR